MRRIEEMRAAVVEHGAPASCRRGYAEAQEAHSGLGENSARHADRRLHDHRLNDVGQNMVNDNAQIARAESACGLHEFAFARDRKSTRLNSSHANISYAVFCLKKKNKT